MARTSYIHPRTYLFYDHLIPVEPEQHEVYKYLAVASLLGCPRERNPVLELEPTPESGRAVDRLLGIRGFDADTRFIGINPGGSKANKRWGTEQFADVGNRLSEALGLPVMILGNSGDLERATEIAEHMTTRPLVVAGRASLGDTAAMLEHCRFSSPATPGRRIWRSRWPSRLWRCSVPPVLPSTDPSPRCGPSFATISRANAAVTRACTRSQ